MIIRSVLGGKNSNSPPRLACRRINGLAHFVWECFYDLSAFGREEKFSDRRDAPLDFRSLFYLEKNLEGAHT
jgi:hypothetical protein